MLRYIRRIDCVPAFHLQLALPLPDGMRVSVPMFVPWERLPIVSLASMETTDSIGDDGSRTFTSKLTAVLPSRPEMSRQPMAYRLTMTDGTQLLLGLSSRPYPVLTMTDTHPDRAAERCACSISVTWAANVGPLEIVVPQELV